jgi:hypothetical protein
MLALAAVRIALALAIAAPTPASEAPTIPSATPSVAPGATAPAALVDFYTADRSTSLSHDEFELRLRDDGKAWLVTVSGGAAQGRFETGTWRADGTLVRVDLDTTATVVRRGTPTDPHPETESLSLTLVGCTLTSTASSPPNALGEPTLAVAQRHCP